MTSPNLTIISSQTSKNSLFSLFSDKMAVFFALTNTPLVCARWSRSCAISVKLTKQFVALNLCLALNP